MNGMPLTTFLLTLADHPLAPLFALALQLIVITLVATLIVRWIPKTAPDAAHRLWSIAILLALAIFPLQMLGLGWTLRLAIDDVTTVAETAAPSDSVTADIGFATSRSDALAFDHATADSRDPGLPMTEPGIPTGDTSTSTERTPAIATTSAAAPMSRWWSRAGSAVGALGVSGALVVFYLAGVSLYSLRLVSAMIRLRRLARQGVFVNEPSARMADSVADVIGLSAAPDVRLSEHVAVPMVVGLVRSTVLVPADFENWTDDEKRATLIHEMTHVRRADLLFRYLSAFNRVLYWFHPASWFLDQRLSESREWATDQEVVRQSDRSGLSGPQYAASLLSVVSRLSGHPTPRGRDSLALAMSAGGEVETRLRRILDEDRHVNRSRKTLVRLAAMTLIAVTACSTVQLRRAIAQAPQDQSADKATSTAATPTDRGKRGKQAGLETSAESSIRIVSVRPGDEDLWQRISRAEPLDFKDRDNAVAIIDASGQVLSPEGAPVAGAVVLLRESSTTRISRDNAIVYSDEALYLRESHDVLSRTTTDSDGRFEFSGVMAPPYSIPLRGQWSGDIVAAHPETGVGYVSIGDRREKRLEFAPLQIQLKPTTSISGTYVSPDGDPVSGATVNLWRLAPPTPDPSSGDRMDLQSSQLTLRAVTDEDGHFEFRQLPDPTFASLYVWDGPTHSGNITIMTSEGMNPELMSRQMISLRDHAVRQSPATIVAVPGFPVSGRVRDEFGNPVADAMIGFGGLVRRYRTDEDGTVSLIMSSFHVDHYRKRGDGSIQVVVFPKPEESLMLSSKEVAIDRLIGGDPFEVVLRKGVRVSGRFVDPSGTPLSGVVAHSHERIGGRSARSDDEGRFEMVLPAEKRTLIFCSDRPELPLPSTREVRAKLENAEGLLKRDVDLTDGLDQVLPDVTIPKSQPIEVIVSLPDGSPAVDVNVSIMEDQTTTSSSGRTSSRRVEKSDTVLTNSVGRAQVTPKGAVSKDAWVDLSLTRDGTAYKSTPRVSAASKGVLAVVLEKAPMLEGRVLIDGTPVAGARLSIGESRPLARPNGGAYVPAFTTSNHVSTSTDAEGYYRLPVKSGYTYSVSLQSIPNESAASWISFTASPTGDEVVRVKDFELYRGTEQISGVVVDAGGAPVAEASVRIVRDSRTNPSCWIGHHQQSQAVTDSSGHFHLRLLPPGRYQISVTGKRSKDRSIPPVQTTTAATTGTSDLTIRLAGANRPTPLPRLKPVQIKKLTP